MAILIDATWDCCLSCLFYAEFNNFIKKICQFLFNLILNTKKVEIEVINATWNRL